MTASKERRTPRSGLPKAGLQKTGHPKTERPKGRRRSLKFGSADGGDHKLDMTSMIDIVFLLLVFFVFTARFLPEEFDLSSALPRQRGVNPYDQTLALAEVIVRLEAAPIGGDPVATIRSVGMRQLRIPEEVRIPLTADTAEEALKSTQLHKLFSRHAGRAGRDVPVTVHFGERVRTQSVITVMDACQRAGLTNVGIAAKENA